MGSPEFQESLHGPSVTLRRAPWTAEEIVTALALEPTATPLVKRARDWVARRADQLHQVATTEDTRRARGPDYHLNPVAKIADPTEPQPRRFDWDWLISEMGRMSDEIEQIKNERALEAAREEDERR